MAPVQCQNSYSTQESSFNVNPRSCHCGSSFLNDWEWWLPVSRRGHFFQDSFFEDTRAYFDAAVKEVLRKWGDREIFNELWQQDASSSLFDNLSRYRQLRTSNGQEENQVTTLISDNNSHKVVMDVHDLMDGEIKVKVVGEKEVVVEGQGFGLLSSPAFSRRFSFPETANMAAITSVLSSDGVLTIEAPRLQSTTSNLGETAVTITRSSTEDTKHTASIVVDDKENEKVFYCKGCNKRIGPWETAPKPCETHQEGMKIPIKINATVTNDFGWSSASPASKLISPKTTSNSHVEEIDKDVSHKMRNEKTNCDMKRFSAEKNTSITSGNCLQTPSSGSNYNVPISTSFTSLPIIKRGMFFSDSIFDDIRKDFQSAVQDVLSKWGETSSLQDDLSSYRNLRSRDLREENQAVKVTEDNSSHKVVLDVHDFMNGGDITVKAINDRELVVEGHIEKQEQGSKTQKRFLKRFVLPGDIQLSSVTSVLSSDGVLTLIAPKKQQAAQLREFIIPISIDRVEDRDKEDVNHVNTTQEDSKEKSQKNSFEAYQDSFVSSVKNQSSHSSRSDECNTISSEQDSQSSVNSHKVIRKPSRERIIPVHVEGICNQSNSEDVKCKRKPKKEHHVTKIADNCENTISKGFQETEATIMEEARNSSTMKNQNNFILQQTDKRQFAKSAVETVTDEANKSVPIKTSSARPSNGRYLPIARRGTFFGDSFFEGYQKDFETAVSEVLLKSRENVKDGEMMNTYRSLRQRNLKVENQALKVHEDQSSLRVVLDVKDFTDGDITVSVEGEELVIEGRTEKTENKSSDSLTFSHRFLLPEATDFTAITSAISSDGVLTINSPKTGNAGVNAVRKISSEAESKHESLNDGSHYWEKKNKKESSQQSKGFSSHTLCSSYHSKQQHSSLL